MIALMMTLMIGLTALARADELALPDELLVIESEAFLGNSSLGTVTLPEGLLRIESRAFANSSVEAIKLPASLTFIAEDAFSGSALRRVVARQNSYAFDWAVEHGYLDQETDAGLFTYSAVSGGKVTVKGFADEADYPSDIVIPAYTLEGYAITAVGENAFKGLTGLTSVVVGRNVTTIGAGAFKNCAQLESVTLPEGLTAINAIVNWDEGAFSGCSSLKEIELPATLESIGNYTFHNCSSLETLTILDSDDCTLSIGESAFVGAGLKGTLTIPAKVSAIKASAFAGTPIEALAIEPGSNLTTISNGAFNKCLSLVSADIPGNVTAINANAFKNCNAMKNLTLSEGLKTIGGVVNGDEGAFSGCVAITELVLPSTLESIGNYAFHNLYGLKSLTILDSDDCALSIGESAFAGAMSLRSALTIPAKVSDIKASAFAGTPITALVIQPGDNLTTISNGAFMGCYSLTTVDLPGNVTTINQNAFKNCGALKNLTLPEGLKTIAGVVNGNEGAFSGCSSLTELVIPSTMESIGNYAFYQCTGIETLTILDSDQCALSIGERAFNFTTSLTGTVVIPKKVSAIKAYAFGGSSLEKLDIRPGDNLEVISENAFRGCASLTTVTIPGNVTSIHAEAFKGCTALTKLTLSEGLKTILGVVNGDAGAFSGCSALPEVVIPSTVESLGRYTFCNCTSLRTIRIKAKAWNITIGENAFKNCPGVPEYVD